MGLRLTMCSFFSRDYGFAESWDGVQEGAAEEA